MLQLMNENFKNEVLEHNEMVLVDFYATSCGPCRLLEPILKKTEENHTNVKFAKVEASDALDVFSQYKVNHVPTLILFKDGKELDRKIGLVSETALKEWIKTKSE